MMIKDAQIIPLEIHRDERGYLIEILRKTDHYFRKFGQVYIVATPKKGTIRTWHKHKKHWDYFFVAQGKVKVGLVDDRPESSTYQKKEFHILPAITPSLLIIPPGVYHGSASLEDQTLVISTSTEVYNRQKPDEIRVDPDYFGEVWQDENTDS